MLVAGIDLIVSGVFVGLIYVAGLFLNNIIDAFICWAHNLISLRQPKEKTDTLPDKRPQTDTPSYMDIQTTKWMRIWNQL